MTTKLIAGLASACLLASSLAGCGTLGGGIGLPGASANASAAASQLTSTLNAFNTAAAQHCAGTGALDWTPPFPPTGSLHVQCVIGQQMVPLSQIGSILQAQTAATPAVPPATPAPVPK